MASQEKRQNPYEIELPQSIIDSLIPSPDSLCMKFRNSMPVTRGKKSLRHGKRSILIKARSDIKFSTDKGRATLILGSPSFTNYANR